MNIKKEFENQEVYIDGSNCYCSTIKTEGRTTLKNRRFLGNLDFKGFVTINLLDFYKYIKFLKSMGLKSVELSIFNFKFYVVSKTDFNLINYRAIFPIIEPSQEKPIQNNVTKINLNFILNEFKTYKLKDIRGVEIRVYMGTEYPVYFKISKEHKFIIAPIVDNN